jgi:PAS domain S-box-containing protein
MLNLENVIDAHIIKIATDGIKLYEDYIQETAQKNRLIIYIIISLSFVLILVILGFSFLPLHQKLLHSSNVLKQERLIHATERKRLKLALEGTSTGIWDLDLNIEYFVWNNILQEIMGITYDEDNYISLGEFYEMIHEEDRSGFKTTFQDHINNGQETRIRFEHEVRLKHQKGHYIWAHVIGQAMWKDGNIAYRMIGSIEDITSRKEAEIEKNIFINGIESCNIAFGIIDLSHPSRNFRYASQEFCDLTGHSPKSLRQKNMNVFTGPQTSMSDLDKIDYAINEGKKASLKMLSYRVNGTHFWNKVTLSPITIEDNKNTINHYIITFDDLTHSIEFEKQEVLRQRNESLGSLAASVAHEINNLLMPMSMAKDILEDELKEECDPFAREQLDIIVDYANQAKEIVQGILTFSRKGTDDLKKVTLFQELSDATYFIQSLLQAKTKLILNTPSDEDVLNMEAMVNSTEMKQIFTNMCRNAEHALGENSGLIEISLDKQFLSNVERTKLNVIAADFATIAVTDNGTGISQEHLEKIFDPLFTTKDVGAGTGLGLSVVHGIIRSWGGAITVDSVEGKGTTFTLYIPIHKSNDDFSDLMDLLEDEE